jgi:hypothetical protein
LWLAERNADEWMGIAHGMFGDKERGVQRREHSALGCREQGLFIRNSELSHRSSRSAASSIGCRFVRMIVGGVEEDLLVHTGQFVLDDMGK